MPRRRCARLPAAPTRLAHRDRLLRVLVIPTPDGLAEIATTDSRSATIVAEYWNAVQPLPGDRRRHRPCALSRRSIIDAQGNAVPLLTDLANSNAWAPPAFFHFNRSTRGPADGAPIQRSRSKPAHAAKTQRRVGAGAAARTAAITRAEMLVRRSRPKLCLIATRSRKARRQRRATISPAKQTRRLPSRSRSRPPDVQRSAVRVAAARRCRIPTEARYWP